LVLSACLAARQIHAEGSDSKSAADLAALMFTGSSAALIDASDAVRNICSPVSLLSPDWH
jgi:hypothetical protein